MGPTPDDHSADRPRDPDRSTGRSEALSKLNQFREWGNLILIVLLSAILLLGIVNAVTGRSTPHEQLEERLVAVERTVQFIACIALIPDDMRLPAAVADCQVDS